jgi:hypothetical protein
MLSEKRESVVASGVVKSNKLDVKANLAQQQGRNLTPFLEASLQL